MLAAVVENQHSGRVTHVGRDDVGPVDDAHHGCGGTTRETASEFPPHRRVAPVEQIPRNLLHTALVATLFRPEHAARIIPESFLLVQEIPKKRAGGVSLTGVKLEQMLSELTLPGDTSGPGREAQRAPALTSPGALRVFARAQRK